jgi:hypothetical protein
VCLRAPIGVPDARWCPKERPLGYVNRKPGPVLGASTLRAGLGANWGEGLPRLSPDNGKEASPEGEYRNLRGVELRKNGEGQKGPRGRGLPAGIPEAQPAAPGLMGG